jgi:hypothetical protein
MGGMGFMGRREFGRLWNDWGAAYGGTRRPRGISDLRFQDFREGRWKGGFLGFIRADVEAGGSRRSSVARVRQRLEETVRVVGWVGVWGRLDNVKNRPVHELFLLAIFWGDARIIICNLHRYLT